MSALLALVATILTSFLPILNKRILQDARPGLVAWAINAFSLPLLALGTFLLTQCRATPLSCTTHRHPRRLRHSNGYSPTAEAEPLGFDCVIDVTGMARAMEDAFSAVKGGGKFR